MRPIDVVRKAITKRPREWRELTSLLEVELGGEFAMPAGWPGGREEYRKEICSIVRASLNILKSEGAIELRGRRYYLKEGKRS
jgi:hypothetical protein